MIENKLPRGSFLKSSQQQDYISTPVLDCGSKASLVTSVKKSNKKLAHIFNSKQPRLQAVRPNTGTNLGPHEYEHVPCVSLNYVSDTTFLLNFLAL